MNLDTKDLGNARSFLKSHEILLQLS